MFSRRSHAFTVVELLVCIAIMSILLAILLPAAEKIRHRGYIDACASNLRQIGQAMEIYAGENHGSYPRTIYLPDQPPVEGTNPAAINPFAAGGPQANDVTAALFLLLRAQHLPARIFICPYDDVVEYEADTADAQSRSNFTDYKKNCGYSLANPYPSSAAAALGYRWVNKFRADFALASDVNPGTDAPRDDVLTPMPNSPVSLLTKANSANHEKEGQNVLFGDGHVVYLITPFCGVANDNIFTNKQKQVNASPIDKDDSVLLPTDD